MQIFNNPQELQQYVLSQKRKGQLFSLVPTMGFLHKGHISLMHQAKVYANNVIVSIFVNPTQFAPNEDLDKYPRDFEGDEKKCKDAGVDIIFYPSNESIYPADYQTFVNVEKVSQNLCGASRPHHFQGVTTVVAKLFNICLPDYAFFGEKDFQQLTVIKRMTKDLNFPIEIIPVPTFREDDGLAMSSRNKYLKGKEREDALVLYKSIKRVSELFSRGEKNVSLLLSEAQKIISSTPLAYIDYIKIVDIETMDDVDFITKDSLFALAVKIGSTRLIDNCKLLLTKGEKDV